MRHSKTFYRRLLSKGAACLALIAVAATSGSSLFAGDEELVDILLQKGVLNNTEADQLKARVASNVEIKGQSVQKLTIGGNIQAQWDVLSTDLQNESNPSAENSWNMRRLRLGATADLGNGWEGVLVADFSADTDIDKAYISKELYDGASTLYVGYLKAPFGIEETSSSTTAKTIERSAANNYFIKDLNWGAGVVGAQLKGSMDPLSYHFAVTNIDQGDINEGSDSGSNNETNSPAFWGRLGLDLPTNGDMKVSIGADMGLLMSDAVDQYTTSTNGNGSRDAVLYSIYSQMDMGQMSLLLQMIGAEVEDASANSAGTANSADASPWAFSITPSIMVSEKAELVASFSYIDSDGIGINPSEVTRRSNVGAANYWDKFTEYYAGMNYYLKGNDVKFMVGYVYAEGDDVLTGRGAAENAADQGIDINGLRARLQLLF